jgi:adenosylcobyric acid synthase
MITGYEIHMGITKRDEPSGALFKTIENTQDGAVSESGKIWGTYFHGVFDDADFRRCWLKTLGWQVEGRSVSLEQKRDEEIDLLAKTVKDNIDMNLLDRIIGI